MMLRTKKEKIVFSWRDTAVSIAILFLAIGITSLTNTFGKGDETYVPMIFLLAVFLISLWTTGYLYGIISSIFGVFFVNYVFTYPYYTLDFSVEGYPLTFTIMIIVAVLTSTMTSNLKQHEKLKLEIETEKMKYNLLRAISHDLRTPLTSIIGSINTIIDNYKVVEIEERIELLKNAKEEAEWLVRLVENILLVTKMGTDNAELQLQDQVVEEIVSEAVQKFHKHFPEQKVHVKVPEEILIVSMDGILIEEVLTNLMENSVKHSEDVHKIDIIVAKEEDFAVFSVRDYGQGFKKEVLSHMFEGNLISPGKKNSDGSKNMGIGLSLCNTIIKAHKGKMSAVNAKEGGAIVTFTLPLRKE